MRHLELIADGLIAAVKSHVGAATGPLLARLNELDAALKAVPAGEKGDPGKSVTIDDVAPMVASIVAKAVSEMPPPKPGEPGKAAEVDYPRIMADVAAKMKALVDTSVTEAVAKIPAPEPGKDADPEAVRAIVVDEVAKAVGALPPAKEGEPGKDAPPVDRADLAAMVAAAVDAIPRPKDGEHGKSVTPADVLALLAPLVNQWALDFERRAQDVFAAAIERMPKAKDGADGFNLEDLDAAIEEDGRTLRFKFVRGDLVKEWRFKLAIPLDMGIYRPDAVYDKGDCVSLGGSGFIAQKDAPAGKPGESDDWRLFVKRGRDGKDGKAVGTGGHEIVRLHA